MRGPPPFVACTTAQRAGGCAPCRGPAGPRGRVPVWPLSAARVGPRAAMRGGCPHTLQGMRKKCRTAGPAGRPAPLRGRASRWPLGGFFARPADGAHFPLASMRCSGFWLPWLHPLARLPGSRECRGAGGCPLWGPAALGVVPRSFALPPCIPVALRFPLFAVPLVVVGPCPRMGRVRGPRPPPLRAATVYRRC